jgi:hypothetical protein
MGWIDLAQDRDQWRDLVNTIMNHRVPYNVGKCLSRCATDGFSRRAQLLRPSIDLTILVSDEDVNPHLY